MVSEFIVSTCSYHAMHLVSPTVFTDVACYRGATCGSTPVVVSTISECCSNISTLSSYITAADVNTCNPCLGKHFTRTYLHKIIHELTL